MGLFDFDVICVIGKRDNLEEYIRFKYDDNGTIAETGFKPRGQCFSKAGFVPIIWITQKPAI